MKNLGIVLIGIGIIMMIFTGFTYVTKKNIADIGQIEINQEEHYPVEWPPIVGGALLVVGFIFVLSGKKKSV